jgi:hypothetical protein
VLDRVHAAPNERVSKGASSQWQARCRRRVPTVAAHCSACRITASLVQLPTVESALCAF